MAQHMYFKARRHKELGFDKPLLLKMWTVRKVVEKMIGMESIKDWVFEKGNKYETCIDVEFIDPKLILPIKTEEWIRHEKRRKLVESIKDIGIQVPLLTVAFDEETISSLVSSLNEKNLPLCKLLKRMHGAKSKYKYKTFEGGQRTAAALILGIEKVPALLFTVQPYTLD